MNEIVTKLCYPRLSGKNSQATHHSSLKNVPEKPAKRNKRSSPMPEKSATAVQTATSRPPVKSTRIEGSLERLEHLNDAISRRAVELYEREGRVDGQVLRHWMEAEGEILHPVHMKMEDAEGELVVRAERPGFTAS